MLRSIFLFVALATLACLAPAPAHAVGTGLNLNVQTGSVYAGVPASLVTSFDKNSADGVTYHAPFTLHVHLPTGIKITSSNSGGVWTCPSFGSGLQDVSCTYSGNLTPAQYLGSALSFAVDIAPATPIGTANARVTVESAELPLPPTPTCGPSPSNTGCVDSPYNVQAPALNVSAWGGYAPGRVAVWSSDPFEAGTETLIEVDVLNIGYGPGNGPIVAKIKLPPHVTFSRGFGGFPSFTCTGESTPDGPVASCTTSYMIDHQSGFFSFYVNVALDVPVPGPLVFYAGISNNVQTIPANCVAQPDQTGCGRLTVNTRVPRVAYMRFAPVPNDVSHSPHVFWTNQHGSVQVNFQNGGEASAAQTSLVMKLPPYVSFDHQLASLPALSCTSSGSAASGPVVTCTGPGLPASTSGDLSFDVKVGYQAAAPGPLVIVGGIDAANPATTTTLASCTSDPNHANCSWHEITSYAPCAAQYGDDGVYCDGFQGVVLPQ
jgi:hypothetical protein